LLFILVVEHDVVQLEFMVRDVICQCHDCC